MDVLSEVLRAVKLEGALFFNAEFCAPWCVDSPQSAQVAPYLCEGAEHLIIYHYLIDGTAYAKLKYEDERVELTAGDIVIFPHGDAHLLGHGVGARPLDGLQLLTKFKRGLSPARLGEGGSVTRFVCGFMACEPRLSEVFLAGLPKILKVNIGKEPSGRWLENSIQFSACELNQPDAGSRMLQSKLSEVLFAETLRCYINRLPQDQTGWLAGLRDPAVGKALALLHEHPEYHWTVSSLVRRIGSSRTRLGERFRHFLGESPMTYLTHWRLKLAAEMLQSRDNSVAEIAADVGYNSEAAFNRAFKRVFGCPPAKFRRSHRPAPLQSLRAAS